MARFKFNFSEFGKPKVKRAGSLPRREIIQKNIIGVIGINLDATYYVEINNERFNLTLESYDIKGKNVFYARKLQNNKVLNIIELKKHDRNSKHYLPFAVGSIVKGNLYLIMGVRRFNISKILDGSDLLAEEAIALTNLSHLKRKYFRQNYEEIIKCMD